MKDKYRVNVSLQQNEVAAKINKETGEIKEVRTGYNNIPDDREIFEPQALFKKDYTQSWKYLFNNLSALEFKAAYSLALMAKANTNSLEPLSDETTYQELSKILKVGKNKVDKVLKRLFEIGVYGRFEVYDKNKPYTKFWLLNPYLSFDGKLIRSDIANLFKGTEIALNFKNVN